MPPYLTTVPDALRHHPGPWYIFGANEAGQPAVILAGPFLSATEAERLVPAVASLYTLLTAAGPSDVEGFGIGALQDVSVPAPLLNPFIGLQENGAPLSADDFQSVLDTLRPGSSDDGEELS